MVVVLLMHTAGVSALDSLHRADEAADAVRAQHDDSKYPRNQRDARNQGAAGSAAITTDPSSSKLPPGERSPPAEGVFHGEDIWCFQSGF